MQDNAAYSLKPQISVLELMPGDELLNAVPSGIHAGVGQSSSASQWDVSMASNSRYANVGGRSDSSAAADGLLVRPCHVHFRNNDRCQPEN